MQICYATKISDRLDLNQPLVDNNKLGNLPILV